MFTEDARRLCSFLLSSVQRHNCGAISKNCLARMTLIERICSLGIRLPAGIALQSLRRLPQIKTASLPTTSEHSFSRYGSPQLSKKSRATSSPFNTNWTSPHLYPGFFHNVVPVREPAQQVAGGQAERSGAPHQVNKWHAPSLVGESTQSKRRRTVIGSITRSYCGGRSGPRSRSAICQIRLAK